MLDTEIDGHFGLAASKITDNDHDALEIDIQPFNIPV
jgi:hypothetical protein